MSFIKKKIIVREDLDNSGDAADLANEVIDAGIEDLTSDDSSANIPTDTVDADITSESITEENDSKRFYNWLDVSEILSNYLSDEAVITMNSLMANQFKDSFMTQSDVDEILADLPDLGFTPDQLESIKSKLSELRDPSIDIEDAKNSVINTLKDLIDQPLPNNIKEKIVNFIGELENE